ncbi:NADH-quinone oxidoreductase subunit L [Lacihabitans sp. CCS-44]|uniref:NADH-quinone oxidoreductase subunit L n=1 Tax=Lacihabitans sp. CCS-44 TaxID=2487331 RepID=UPI0020CD7B78|nr:NADH-quinone oxidoreductase subunit L [Lacihabitans sp. CCS-44]
MTLISLIPLFPLIGFLINGIGFGKISKTLVPIIGTGASLLSFGCVLAAYLQFDGTPVIVNLFDWITVGDLNIKFSFQFDQLSLIMLFVITGVGTLIHLYSAGYMSHDEGYGKFFAYLNLFLFSMILLVLGANYLIMFIGWEGVGLCSYLLIGFWNKNTDYANAARKAFIMNRVGDLGFLVGIFLIIQTFGTLEYLEVFEKAKGFQIGDGIILAITFALFVGAMGKSAQIPLFTWLPDAMAGPTPVSALIHAATMVTSGIYMTVRSNILYSLSPQTLEFVAWIGLATALLGATIGLFQNDIKKVLAYSTVSQLGYMFLGLGVMAYSSGLFHVITHAFFKALLFLGAGSVIHAMSGDQDIRNMGGLWPKIKITAITFLVGTIAISGIPPFSGFFSKDEILAHVYEHNKLMWVLALLGSFMTAFYMFRLFFVTFKGNFRGTHDQEHHLHESPSSMTLPLIVLAVFSIIGGAIGFPEIFHFPHRLNEFLSPIYEGSKSVNPAFGVIHLDHSTEWLLMGVSVVVAIVAIIFAYSVYGNGKNVPVSDESMSGIKKVVYDKYYIDELYNKVFVNSISSLSKFFGNVIDNKFIDGIVNGVGNTVNLASAQIKRIQVGGTSSYLLFMTIGIILLLGYSLVPGLFESLKSVIK